MSIRTRLAIAVALVLFITFGVLGVVLVRSTRATLIGQVDQQVLTNAGRAAGNRPPSKGKGPDAKDGSTSNDNTIATSTSTPDVNSLDERPVARFAYNASGALIVNETAGFIDDPKSPPSFPSVTSPAIAPLYNTIVTTESVDRSLSYRMLIQKDNDGDVLITAASLETVNDAMARFERILLLAGAIALAATTLVAWLVIRTGLRPVDRMVGIAAGIAAGDLSLRVPDADPRTELGQLGRALNVMLHQIEDAVRARAASEERLRRFIGDAAHELRTPLTSVRGYAELYRQGAIGDRDGVANAMGRIEAEGGRMARLVDDMLLLARLDQQRGLEMREVDLVSIAKEAVADFGAVDPERPLTPKFAPSAVVIGDRIRLRQILDNLLANARIHTQPRTPIGLSVAVEGQEAVIVVADKGAGIPPEHLERIFERFWRADPARARSRGGSGLGLSIVASLVESHAGTVSAVSELGAGTAFTVRLPLAPGPRFQPARPSA